MAWWQQYYRVTFPPGKLTAYTHFQKTIGLLKQNAFLGRPVEDHDIRLLNIPNTPFSLVYRLRGDTLEIVRVWDMRRQPSHGFHEE